MSDERLGPDNGSDAAIKTMSEDRLARAAFAIRIAQRIVRTGTGPSIVFGLAGPWGSGKTSMLSMIGEGLMEVSADADTDVHHWSVVYFTPWAASDIDSLTTEFYTAIASALPEKATKARALLKAATPVAAAVTKKLMTAAIDKWAPGGVDAAWEAGADTLADQLGTVKVSEDPFQVRFEKISAAIEEAGARVLIVVDDLDRLHTDELLAVMKAVRLLGRFPNVHYLLAYDKTTVLDVLTASDLARGNRDRAHRYLEKIVQYPFVLPPIQRVHIETELRDGLLSVATNLGLGLAAPATQYAVNELINVLPDADALTLRSIKQLCLQTDVLCSMVGPGETDLFDAAVITYIRLKYPDLYDQVQTWRPLLLTPDHRTTGASDEWLGRIRATVHPETSGETVTAIYRMLVALFPALPHAQGAVWTQLSANCRINDPDYFPRYFQFAIPEEDLSDAEVRAAFRQLVQHGELDEGSIISHHVNVASPQWRKLMSKMNRNLDVVDGSPSVASAAAAHWLTRKLFALQAVDLYYGWGSVIFGVLAHAAATAETAEDGGRILNDYCDEFGLYHTAPVLTHRPIADATPDDQLSIAARGIRGRVVQACLHDLRTPSVPAEEQLLSYARVMDDAMWAQLRAALRNSEISQQDIAARFVHISRTNPSSVPVMDHFYDDLFSKIVPDDELDLSGFTEPSTVNEADLTISGRREYAAYALRRSSPPYRVRRDSGTAN